jgi:hypothetical protein
MTNRPIAAMPIPVSRRERLIFCGLAALLVAAVLWLFILHVWTSGAMSEYAFKFLPFMTDKGWISIFDGNAIGDPRPRVIAMLLTYLNILIRRFLLLRSAIHPSLGVAWLFYPLAIALMYRVAIKLSADHRTALIAALLYAASPALLDTLVNYYVPAKALSNILMLLSIYGGCLMFPPPQGYQPSRPGLGAAIVFVASLAGLLSDETAVFIYICVPLLFIDRLFNRSIPAGVKAAFVASLAASLVAYALLALLAIPALNRRLGQVPIDLWGVVTRGVYDTMFLTAAKPVAGLISNVSPGALLETMLSAHTVPYRLVRYIWTSGDPLPHIWQWRRWDQLGLLAFAGIVLFLVWQARRDAVRSRLLLRIALPFAAFVVVESVLLLRLAPWIVEVNYYAAFSSLFFALIMATLIAGLRKKYLGSAAWIITAYLALVQFSNFYQTAQRHPSIILDTQLGWQLLQDVHNAVAQGNLADVVAAHPFPSRLFSIGFEQAVAIEHAAGRRVDLRPMQRLDSTIYHFVGMEHLQDPNILPLGFPPLDQAALAATAKAGSGGDLARRLGGRTIRGQSEGWEFLAHVSQSGEIHERAWLPGVMRVWGRKGMAVVEGGSLCLELESYPPECIARTFDQGEVTYGFSEAGKLVAAFRWLPQETRLPRDLRE